MRKRLFLLVATICSVSVNAQKVKFMKGNTVVATYDASQIDNVVFEDETLATTGTAKARINGQDVDVKWVQLWDNGPQFAEYNVGVTDGKPESDGGLYCWGKTQVNGNHDYKTGNFDLSGNDDTATALWGSNWRMPTEAECNQLVQKCNSEWVTINGVNGRKFTGKGDYSDNSVFFPAAGCQAEIYVDDRGYYGYYWTKSYYATTTASYLYVNSTKADVASGGRDYGQSVRAVLK